MSQNYGYTPNPTSPNTVVEMQQQAYHAYGYGQQPNANFNPGGPPNYASYPQQTPGQAYQANPYEKRASAVYEKSGFPPTAPQSPPNPTPGTGAATAAEPNPQRRETRTRVGIVNIVAVGGLAPSPEAVRRARKFALIYIICILTAIGVIFTLTFFFFVKPNLDRKGNTDLSNPYQRGPNGPVFLLRAFNGSCLAGQDLVDKCDPSAAVQQFRLYNATSSADSVQSVYNVATQKCLYASYSSSSRSGSGYTMTLASVCGSAGSSGLMLNPAGQIVGDWGCVDAAANLTLDSKCSATKASLVWTRVPVGGATTTA
ncbi:hypothetical protein HDU96_000157 [Phlyctochytrium bullatum]|nr:hypothetical protein HDU96_000157 [Phlyctochytrium bullatum]